MFSFIIVLKKFIILFIFAILLISCSSKQDIDSFKYDSNLILDGVVSSLPKLDNGDIEFVFHTEKYGDFLLKVNQNAIHYIVPANRLELEAKLYDIHEYKNVGAFNYNEYLDNRNITTIGFVDTKAEILYKGTSVWYLPERLRFSLYNYLNNQLGGYSQKPLVLALLIGDKDFSPELSRLFQNTGTSHLVVISGLHIGLLALVAFVIFRILWSLSPRLCRAIPAQYVAVVLSLISAFAYSLLAGFTVPTQRAVIMLMVFSIFWLMSKRISIVRSIIYAFILVMIIDYKSIFGAGTWLSFSAVIFLIFISAIVSQYKSKFTKMILAQIVLSIFLIPITIYYFNGFSAVSISANIIAIPFVSFIIVPILFLSLILSFIGIKLWFLVNFLIQILLSYLDLLNGEFSFVTYSANFSIWSLLLVLLGLGILFLPIAKSFRLLGLALVMIIFQPVVNLTDKYDILKIHVFDIKDLMVIIQNDGIDTLYISSNVDDYSLQTVLQPYLRLEGIKQLSYVVVTGGAFNADVLKFIVPVDKIVSKNDGDLACEYSNSWTIKNDTFNLIPYADNCILNIKNEYKDILIISAKSSVQKKIYSLYGLTINADMVITSDYLNIDFVEKLKVKYLIYSSSNSVKSDYLDQLRPIAVKVVDTHNNGAITISVLSNGHFVIKSLLKNY